MNKRKLLISTIAVFLLALLFNSCSLFGDKVSVSDRMSMFKTDVEAKAWGNLKGHTHPDAGMYNANNDSVWTTIYPLSGTFSYSVSGNTATGTKDSITCTYYLKEDDKNVYKIYRINRDGTDIFQ